MGTRPRIPAELKRPPFTLREARACGISRTALKGKSWRHLDTALYCWAGLNPDPWKLLRAWRGLLPEEAVFAGASAAWLHGLELDPMHPIGVIVPASSGVRSRAGVKVRRIDVPKSDRAIVRDLPATTVIRTLTDLARRLPAVEALVAFDAALRHQLVDQAAMCRSGTRKVRSLAAVAAPAESPMETRLRWALLQGGLPCPEVQHDLRDANGRFIASADLYYPPARLAIEYDGGNHRDRLAADDRRQNLITNSGFQILRFTAADVFDRPGAIVSQVRTALSWRA